MSYQVPTHHVQQFGRNVMFLSQQMGSVLRSCVMEEQITGDRAYIDQLGPVEAQPLVSRHDDTPLISTPHRRRRLTPTPAAWADLIDNEDRVRTINELTSPYARQAAMAFGRLIDRKIIAAAFATSYTGQDGTTTVPFPSSNQIAHNSTNYGSATTGLNIGKLIDAKVRLGLGDVDPNEELFIACTARQIGDLLSSTTVTSADYNTVKALVNGEINSFMGFTFKVTNLIQTNSSGHRRVIAWARSGLGLGVAQELRVEIEPRPDKNYAMQVWASHDVGATRLEEAKVIEIICQEA
jgi:hypothetical protein